MDIDEYDGVAKNGKRPGVRVVGIAVLATLIPICGLLSLLIVRLFN